MYALLYHTHRSLPIRSLGIHQGIILQTKGAGDCYTLLFATAQTSGLTLLFVVFLRYIVSGVYACRIKET